MEKNFNQSLDFCLAHEGGYVDHPKDPGGATNLGITRRTLAAYRGRAVSKQEVRDLKRSTAAEIYRRNYWNMARCDDLPSGVDYCVFDGAVNSGVSQSVKWLQKTVGVKEDGIVGVHTLNAVYAFAASDQTMIDRICADRMRFLKRLKRWRTFGRGWTRRVVGNKPGAQAYDIGVLDRAFEMARGAAHIPMPLDLDDGANAKAPETDWSWFATLLALIFGVRSNA